MPLGAAEDVLLLTFSCRYVWKPESVPVLLVPASPAVQPAGAVPQALSSCLMPKWMTVRSMPETVTALKAWLAVVNSALATNASHGVAALGSTPRTTYARPAQAVSVPVSQPVGRTNVGLVSEPLAARLQ